MSSNDEARRQAQRDVEQNKAPAQTHDWNASDRNAYLAELERQRAQQNR